MRSVAFPVCLFLNVMLFGMCGYMYLLWLQYWHRIWVQKQHEPEYEMSDFRRNEAIIEYDEDPSVQVTRNLLKEEMDKKPPLSFLHRDAYVGKIAATRLNMLKTKTVSRLRQALFDESNNMDPELGNPYGVQPKEFKSNHDNLQCDLYSRLKTAKTLKKTDISGPIRDAIPPNDIFPNTTSFNTCAIVTSAGSLRHSNLGSFIDSHDLVLRFNNAPVQNHENDVGTKTTIRILNSQILSKDEFQFLNSTMYKNITLLVWDPSNYSATTQQWIENPEHNFLESYIKYMSKSPTSNFQILDPSVLWLLWDFIQGHTSIKIKPNPPSSGFLGIALLLPYCSTVNVMEYIPSQRATQRCHYYSQKSDPLCTYGVWHPLAAEKLIALAMSTAADNAVFYDGYISIPGYSRLSC